MQVKANKSRTLIKVAATVLALALIFTQLPVSGLTRAADGDVSDKAAQVLSEQETVDIPLDLERAYIIYGGQTIAYPATKVTLPTGKSVEFAAKADSECDLESVKATIDGKEVELKPDSGTGNYKLTAAELATTSKITVKAAASQDEQPASAQSESADAAADATASASSADSEPSATGNAADAVDSGSADDSVGASFRSPAARSAESVAASKRATRSASRTASLVSANTVTAITSENATVTFGAYASADDRAANRNALAADYEVGLSQTLYGAMKFDFNPGAAPTTGRLTYTYTMPGNIVAKDKAVATLYDDGGNAAGTWEIKGNVVYFYYNEAWALAHPNGGGHFNFDFTLDDSQTEAGTETVISFPGSGTVVSVKVKEGEMTGAKWNAGVENGVVSYTVALNAEVDFDTFIFSDLLEKNLDYVPGSFALDGQPFDVVIAEQADGKHTATAQARPISKGQHTITYQTTVDQDVYDHLKNWARVSDTKNTATWKYGNKGKLKSGSAESTVSVQRSIVGKWLGSSDRKDQVKWVIEVNGGRQMKSDVGGFTVTDKLQKGMTYDKEFVVYGKDWKRYDKGTIPAGATSFTYTFPADAGKNIYYIVYKTTVDDTSLAATYKNSATITPVDPTVPSATSSTKYEYNPEPKRGPETDPTPTFNLDKEVADQSKAATTGDVTWHSKISATGQAGAATGESEGWTLEYVDTLDNEANYETAGSEKLYRIWFTGEPTVYANGTKLVRGVDYEFEAGNAASPARYGYTGYSKNLAGEDVPTAFCIHFITNSDTLKELASSADPSIDVYYDTKCDGDYRVYRNIGTLNIYYGEQLALTKTDTAEYKIDGQSLVSKTASNTMWDDSLKAYVTEWNVKANCDGDHKSLSDLKSPLITIVDTLPEGLTVIEDSIDFKVGRDGASISVARDGYAFEQAGNVATFTVDMRDIELGSGSQPLYDEATGSCRAWVDVTFKTKVESDRVVHDGTDQVLVNTAEASAGDVPFGSDTAVSAYNDKVVSKEGLQSDGEPVVHYTIKVNPKGEKLLAGSDASAVNLKDVLDYRTTVVLSSIKVVDERAGEDITSQCAVTLANDEVDGNGHETSSFSISVPDETPVEVTYDVVLSGTVGQECDITNTASLDGIVNASDKSEKRFKVNHADAGVYGSATSISIAKMDAANVVDYSSRLSGATFELYRVDMSKLPGGQWTDEGLAAASTKVNTVTTDDFGSAVLFEESTQALQYDTLYFFKEVKAPAGYAIDDPSPHFVMLEGEHYAMQNAKAIVHGINSTPNTVFNVTDTKVKATVQLFASKTLTGRTLGAGEFSFELSEETDEGYQVLETVENDGDGKARFSEIAYTFDDIGEHRYKVREVAGSLGGVTYDTAVREFTVIVSENDEGGLDVAYDGYDPEKGAGFTNSYDPFGSIELEAVKRLDGGKPAAGAFTFQIADAQGNVCATATNDADGLVKFPALGFRAAGTYSYVISEVVPDDAVTVGGKTVSGNVVYDARQVEVTVKAVDNLDGTLTVTCDYGEDPAATFENGTLARTGFEFDKHFFGGAGTFDFELAAADADGNVRAGEAADRSGATTIVDDGACAFTVTAQNGAFSGGVAKIAFPEITFAADGDYYYLVKELESGDRSVTTDKAQYLAHVTVAGGEVVGKTFELLYDGENLGATEDLSFYNNKAVKLGLKTMAVMGYADPGARASVYPKAKKHLNGGTDQLVGGEFAFELVDDATGTVLAQAVNDENGDVAFFDEENDPGLAYSKAGTHHYTIREVAGDEAGVVYDDAAVALTVEVTQGADGLEAKAVYDAPAYADGDREVPLFNNTKAGMDVTVQKVSRDGGEGLAGATYALWMVGENGDVLIAEADSGEGGYVTFEDVSLIAGQKYYFKEVAAPAGHTVDPYRTDYYVLNAAGDGLVLASSVSSRPRTKLLSTASEQSDAGKTITVSDEATRVQVNKLDADTHEFVQGATMVIIEEATGEVVDQWVTGTSAHEAKKRLDVGVVYILREVSAPNGYDKVQDVRFEVNETEGEGITVLSKGDDAELTESYKFALYDKRTSGERVVTATDKKPAPKTGDETPLWSVAALIFAGGVLILLLQLFKRRVDS